ncbi:MAG: hypothetical protein A3F72_02645 [Bacteroidetes bacterium RIFCSPLOWO2_12_FULL_35_15]|nr:MAG: hypothetical protein A3F72_02645 [Bacteroidetes bacterium RIFCSPLOWO2_12_FULL_35_15]
MVYLSSRAIMRNSNSIGGKNKSTNNFESPILLFHPVNRSVNNNPKDIAKTKGAVDMRHHIIAVSAELLIRMSPLTVCAIPSRRTKRKKALFTLFCVKKKTAYANIPKLINAGIIESKNTPQWLKFKLNIS